MHFDKEGLTSQIYGRKVWKLLIVGLKHLTITLMWVAIECDLQVSRLTMTLNLSKSPHTSNVL
jgi:hypothetical protein